MGVSSNHDNPLGHVTHTYPSSLLQNSVFYQLKSCKFSYIIEMNSSFLMTEGSHQWNSNYWKFEYECYRRLCVETVSDVWFCSSKFRKYIYININSCLCIYLLSWQLSNKFVCFHFRRFILNYRRVKQLSDFLTLLEPIISLLIITLRGYVCVSYDLFWWSFFRFIGVSKLQFVFVKDILKRKGLKSFHLCLVFQWCVVVILFACQ